MNSSLTQLLTLAFVLASTVPAGLRADIVYEQPHNGSPTLYQSSWFAPDESDWDQVIWDDFTLPTIQAITEVRWRGGYIYGGMYSPNVASFTIAIWATSIANEPDVVHPPLVSYTTGNNATQTPAGLFGGVAMYDYQFTLPAPFQAAAGTKYWVYIYAEQFGVPEWGLARGTGTNSQHFRWIHSTYNWISGDAAFSLLSSGTITFTIDASASPPGSGTVAGTGAYPSGSMAVLTAAPNAGFGFVNWTDNGSQVSSSATYAFAVTANRTLIAHFVPAYAITTSPFPTYGGSTAGDGTFNSGSTVMVSATPAAGFAFTGWTELGMPVSSQAEYSFIAGADRNLVANFEPIPLTAMFTFDNAPIHTSLPIDLSSNGVTAHFSATGSGMSIQPANTMGFTPLGFGGLCIYPNSVFASDLQVGFSKTLTNFSILYAPQELACDDSATMRVTAFLNGVLVGTSTTTAPNPGTWPTGTLTFNSPQGFNGVVVHYNSRPPTCGDWGPIFMADNMSVTPVALPCPADATHNGTVDIDDLVSVIVNWGQGAGNIADINHDNIVNIDDLVMVITSWGICP